MRNSSNGRISPSAIALFLAVIAIINVGLIAVLRKGSDSSSRKNSSSEDYYVITSDSDNADNSSKEETTKTTASKDDPVITYKKSKAPTITQDDMDDLASLYIKSGALSATDSEGYDISDDIEAYYSPDTTNKLRFYLLFKVTDDKGNSSKIDSSFEVDLTGPIIVTTKCKVHVDRGSTINYSDYILYALDKDGTEVDTSSIKHLGKVDTSTPGTYIVTYYATIDGVKTERSMTVIVDDE